MKKIGFFGGCFNPPSNIHIEIANNLIKQKKLDKVIFVPVNDFYSKVNLEKAEHRYNMLKLAVKNYENLEVENIEILENKKLFAVDIFKILNNKYNKEDIYFIMGSDNFEKMPKWKNYEEIKDKYKYIVIERNNELISSTKIRNKIINDEDVSEILNKDVYKYIIKNNLYKNKEK